MVEIADGNNLALCPMVCLLLYMELKTKCYNVTFRRQSYPRLPIRVGIQNKAAYHTNMTYFTYYFVFPYFFFYFLLIDFSHLKIKWKFVEIGK